MNVVIVESPSKAKSINKYLGSSYKVLASVGHVRDLSPKNDAIDTENNFNMKWQTSDRGKKVIKDITDVAKNSENLYLATDPDREGEAIAWHLMELLQPTIPVKRLAFHEITKKAIHESFDHIRDVDQSLVSAQEARRILDRLWGYQVSKKLWFNVKGGLSAGRVQSPAVKIVVDREKERSLFTESEYWSITAEFNAEDEICKATLREFKNNKIAVGKDFDKNTGKLLKENIRSLDQENAEKLAEDFFNSQWKITRVEQKPATQNPYAPFITSTLQQEGIRKLNMSSQQVMRTAQKLYE